MTKTFKLSLRILLLLAVAILVILAVRPRPYAVETTQADIGPLQETVEAEGETRTHDRYTVAAPVSGRLMRIGLHDGDRVAAGQVVAIMRPSPLDDRERAAAAARINSAEALLQAAAEQVAHDRATLEQARRERMRTEQIAGQGIATTQALEQARTAEQLAVKTLAADESRARAMTAQLREARTSLFAADPGQGGSGRSINLRVPQSGAVLRVLEQSERVVAVGTPLLLVGDPRKLEVVVDVLSNDAVRVVPGAAVTLDEWGGSPPLRGTVKVVEPYAVTKISALGIEEQRVNIIVDLIDRPEQLGDGYRVVAKIVTWSQEKVMKIPLSALFRVGERWCIFVVEGGKARQRPVIIGHRSREYAEIISGITPGTTVVLHPSNTLNDGMRVRE